MIDGGAVGEGCWISTWTCSPKKKFSPPPSEGCCRGLETPDKDTAGSGNIPDLIEAGAKIANLFLVFSRCLLRRNQEGPRLNRLWTSFAPGSWEEII